MPKKEADGRVLTLVRAAWLTLGLAVSLGWTGVGQVWHEDCPPQTPFTLCGFGQAIAVRSLAFSRDGRFLATGYGGPVPAAPAVGLWNLEGVMDDHG